MPRFYHPVSDVHSKDACTFPCQDGGQIFLTRNGIMFVIMGCMDLVCTYCNSSGVEVDDTAQGVCMAWVNLNPLQETWRKPHVSVFSASVF